MMDYVNAGLAVLVILVVLIIACMQGDFSDMFIGFLMLAIIVVGNMVSVAFLVKSRPITGQGEIHGGGVDVHDVINKWAKRVSKVPDESARTRLRETIVDYLKQDKNVAGALPLDQRISANFGSDGSKYMKELENDMKALGHCRHQLKDIKALPVFTEVSLMTKITNFFRTPKVAPAPPIIPVLAPLSTASIVAMHPTPHSAPSTPKITTNLSEIKDITQLKNALNTDKIFAKEFEKHLISTYSQENLEYLMQSKPILDMLKSDSLGLDMMYVASAIGGLREGFINEGSKNEANISGTLRTSAINAIEAFLSDPLNDSNKKILIDVLETIDIEVYTMLMDQFMAFARKHK